MQKHIKPFFTVYKYGHVLKISGVEYHGDAAFYRCWCHYNGLSIVIFYILSNL